MPFCPEQALPTGRPDHDGSAKATQRFIDNERVIVTEYRFQPRRQYRLAPPRTRLRYRADGGWKIEDRERRTAKAFAEMKKGAPYFRKEGVEHERHQRQ